MVLTDQAINLATKGKLATQTMLCVITTCFEDNVATINMVIFQDPYGADLYGTYVQYVQSKATN